MNPKVKKRKKEKRLYYTNLRALDLKSAERRT